MAYERELEVALDAAREAGRILLGHYERGTEAWEKSEDNPLTIADLESDRAIARGNPWVGTHIANNFQMQMLDGGLRQAVRVTLTLARAA